MRTIWPLPPRPVAGRTVTPDRPLLTDAQSQESADGFLRSGGVTGEYAGCAMPRKPTLSPSKITTYLACPTKYYWTYLDERGRYYLRSRSYFSFGTTLHKVLQRFHDSGDSGVETAHQAVAAMEESWIDAGYASAQEMQDAMGAGRAIVEAYVERVRAAPATARTILLERMLRKDMGEFVLIGRVDRVDEHEDGTIEVIDYKSGRETVTEEEVAADLAIACYQLLLKERYPDQAVCGSILALRSGDKATASMTPDALAEFERDLRALGIEILNREFENEPPKAKALCEDCDFLPLCRRHPEFDWQEP